MDVAPKLNEEVTTAFPVTEAIGKLKPGVYVCLPGRPSKQDESVRERATQWFVVSDLGLTAINGDDGMHAFVRSLATATPVSGAKVKLVARNNEVLGHRQDRRRGYARFAAGLAKGEGGLPPAVLVAEIAGGDYAFLDLTTTAFDLTDRGVKGREASGPIDAFALHRARRLSRRRKVHLTALVRDRAGKAAAVPVTVIVSRPDGVEHRASR